MTTATERLAIALRPARPGDASFVINSWLKSYASSDAAKVLPREVYFRGQHGLITAILGREGTRVLVACMADDTDAILGWACVEGSVVHFTYVKQTYRRLGVAKRLLAPLLAQACTYTHRARGLGELPVPSRWTFDPYGAAVAGAA